MRRDERGITLVELIIAVSAAVIVIGASTLFIRNALQAYGLASDAVNLKVEAQVLMEQLSTWVMEGNCYGQNTGGDIFVIYNIPRFDSSGSPPAGIPDAMTEKSWKRVIKFDSANGKLYMYSVGFDGGELGSIISGPAEWQDNDSISWDSMVPQDTAHLVSDCVMDFKVDIDYLSSPQKVTIKLSMQSGNQEYEIKNEITMRNMVHNTPDPTTPP